MLRISRFVRVLAVAASATISVATMAPTASAQFGGASGRPDQAQGQRGGGGFGRGGGGGAPAAQAPRGGGFSGFRGGQAAAPQFRGRCVAAGPRFNGGGWRRPVYRRPFVYAPAYNPYPVYRAPIYGYGYRCVIRKRWVHTRYGWRRLPRRVCFY
jgi:hypothetical protein